MTATPTYPDIGPSRHNGVFTPCPDPRCGSILCNGSGPHAYEWDSVEVQKAAFHDHAARQAAEEQTVSHRCAECGGKLERFFHAVYQSGYRTRCTEDARHEGVASLAEIAMSKYGLPADVALELVG